METAFTPHIARKVMPQKNFKGKTGNLNELKLAVWLLLKRASESDHPKGHYVSTRCRASS